MLGPFVFPQKCPMRILALLAALLSLVVVACSRTDAQVAAVVPAEKVRSDIPAEISLTFEDYDAAYVQTQMRGWTVVVSRRLLESRSTMTRRALVLLDRKLADVERTVYRFPLRRLQRVPIWMEGGENGARGLAYHPSEQWLREHGFNPAKAQAVEIHNVRDFLDWEREQPGVVMHELAHAYHHRSLGEDNEDIKSAYDNARRSGRYDSVRYHDGSMRRAYAMNNHREYFAEITEAYFGNNDFYPFNRAELARHDPEGFELMERIWRR